MFDFYKISNRRTSLLTEAETNRSVPMFVLRLKGRLDCADVANLLNTRLAGCDRFASRIEISSNGEDAHFIPLSGKATDKIVSVGESHNAFDCTPHVKPLYVAVGSNGAPSRFDADAGLQDFLSQLANSPIEMPPSAPLWEVLVTVPTSSAKPIAGISSNESFDLSDETLLIFRIHHALADGISGKLTFFKKKKKKKAEKKLLIF